MCGICGILNLNGNSVDRERLVMMNNMVRHRGPDDEGIYISENNQTQSKLKIGLGHRRLSIIDLSASARQPMHNENKTIWIICNGEIYNFPELKANLLAQGHIFSSHSDTEVILHLYEEEGIGCVDKLRGMFAFAIWDENKNKLFLVRDRFGVKPLYYLRGEDCLIFASEIKSILCCKKVREVNNSALYDYLTFGYSLGDGTFFKNIKKLSPGHFLEASREKFGIVKYWDLKFNYDIIHDETWFRERLKTLLWDSVRISLRSDVPIGGFLSGGMDSSSVLAIAALNYGSKLQSFTGKFDEGIKYDESMYAKLVAEKSGMGYNEISVRVEDFALTFPKLIWHLDEPVAGPGIYPQYFVAKLASENNIKVVLGGEGGDELFAGYHRYIRTYLEHGFYNGLFRRAQPQAVGFIKAAANLFSALSKKELAVFFMLRLSKDLSMRYFLLLNTALRARKFFSGDFLVMQKDEEQFEAFRGIIEHDQAAIALDKMAYFDIKSYLPALLQVDDRVGMSAGVEARFPLLDHTLAEFVATIPANIKIKGFRRKHILREAMDGVLPQEVLDRTDKKGFDTPFELWAGRELKDYIHDHLLSSGFLNCGITNEKKIHSLLRAPAVNSNLIWLFLNISVWHEQFID